MIIGLSGYATSGKDEVGRILLERHGFERRAFADDVKVLAFKLGWNGEKDDAGRRFLQDVGAACREVLGADVWVRAVLDGSLPPYVTITDVRYPNEYHAIRAAGGAVWRIERPDVGPANDHESETALDVFPFDEVIRNDCRLTDLAWKVDFALMRSERRDVADALR